MLLVADVGNTNTKIGVFDGQRLLVSWRLTSRREQTADEYGLFIGMLLQTRGIRLAAIHGVAISNVVPPVHQTLEWMCDQYFGRSPFFIEPGVNTRMPLLVDAPREVGADRYVDAFAATAKYGPPLIVIDFGTATTFNCVNDRSEFIGGAIAPGIATSVEALVNREASRAVHEGLHRGGDPGGDGAADELAAVVHAVEGRGRTEVDHDQRRPVLRGRREGVHVAVGADLTRGIDEEGHARVHAGLDEERRPSEVLVTHPFERLVDRRHHVRNGDAVDGGEPDPARLQEHPDEQPVFVGGLLPPARQAPRDEQALPVEHADLRVGVADVSDEQHESLLFSPASGARAGGRLVPGDLSGDHAPDRAPGVDQERSVDVEVHGDAGDAVQRDVPAEGVAEHSPLLANGAEALPLEAHAPRVEFLEQNREHRLAVGRASGLERDRGGVPRQLRRELALTEVHADADYDCCIGCLEAGLVFCSGGLQTGLNRGWPEKGAARF